MKSETLSTVIQYFMGLPSEFTTSLQPAQKGEE